MKLNSLSPTQIPRPQQFHRSMRLPQPPPPWDSAVGPGSPLKLWGLSGLWRIKDPPPRTTQGHTDFVYSIAFSPDGRKLATGSYDKTARVWDMPTGKQSAVLEVGMRGRGSPDTSFTHSRGGGLGNASVCGFLWME